jgi:hypothetical protein
MALNKTSRVNSLPPGAAAKLLPPEILKMAAQVRACAGDENTSGRSLKNTAELDSFYAPLRPKTKDRNFDQDKSITRQQSTLDYIPPDRR